MNGLNIENTSEKLVMSIDKDNFSEQMLLKVMKIARLEYLINKASVNEDILLLDEEIKEEWWKANKDAITAKANA